MALGGYFDESGTHGGAHATLIAGFVGSADAFDAAELAWQAVIDQEPEIDHFHYSKMIGRRKPFEHVDESIRKRLFPKLAEVIADADLKLASVGYHGVWPPPVSDKRFVETCPTAYSFCFQFMCESLNEHAESQLDEVIIPVFAQQEEYAPPALALWNFVRPTNSWSHLGPIGFDDPRVRQSLQMADMIVYELFQFLKGPHVEWREWPLLSRLWKDDETLKRSTLFNYAHNERTLQRMVARGTRPWEPGALSQPVSDEELES